MGISILTNSSDETASEDSAQGVHGRSDESQSIDDGQTDSSGSSSLWSRVAKVVGVLLVLAAILLLARSAREQVLAFAEWTENLGVWAPIVFGAGYALATVLFIPGSLLTLAGGALFGLWQGSLVVFIGATIGASAAFLIARYLARDRVAERVRGKEKFEAIDDAVGKQGRKIVFLLRLTPAMPFTLLNYALGLTKVRFVDYLIACLGMIPGTLLYVYYGKVAGDLTELAAGATAERDWKYYTLLGVGLVAAIAVTALVTRIAKRALEQAAGSEVVDES